MEFEWSQHAIEQLAERGISQEKVEAILANPDQVIHENGKSIFQGLINEGDRPYLIRIFVNTAIDPYKIITLYKTSKIKKYYEGQV